MIYFTKTSIGYGHLATGKVCQDFSASYHDEERTIVTACDGHGGNVYVRSHIGSKFASEAIIQAFSRLKVDAFDKLSEAEIAENLRLNILCEWNAMVERHISKHPSIDDEAQQLTDEEKFRLITNLTKAYGSTLNGAMFVGNKLVCANLGDGGVFIVKDGQIQSAFADDDDEPVANITYSLCQEDAYKHLNVSIFDARMLDGVIICTDGVVNPYQNLTNFNESFAQPICTLARKGELREIEQFVVKLGTEIGIGDDVSLGLILNNDVATLPINREEVKDVSTSADDNTANE